MSSLAVHNPTIFCGPTKVVLLPRVHMLLFTLVKFLYCRHSQKPQCADEVYESAREAHHIKFLHLDDYGIHSMAMLTNVWINIVILQYIV